MSTYWMKYHHTDPQTDAFLADSLQDWASPATPASPPVTPGSQTLLHDIHPDQLVSAPYQLLNILFITSALRYWEPHKLQIQPLKGLSS